MNTQQNVWKVLEDLVNFAVSHPANWRVASAYEDPNKQYRWQGDVKHEFCPHPAVKEALEIIMKGDSTHG